jgi:hypothetical protein
VSLYHDPKSLRDSLELDYFRRPRPLARWLWRGNGIAFALALACVGWALWPTQHAAFQAGPVATPHALVGNDCQTCHDRPFATAARFVGDAHPSVSDQACIRCHAGPDHHPTAPAHDCAGCHREHRGTAALARVADEFCLECHRTPGPVDGKPFAYEPVRSFAAHPEFDCWRKPSPDPGMIAFNHAKHLALSEDVLRKVGPERNADLAAHYTRLREQQCGYCHQPDAAGRYMEPIRYDRHCVSCHPLGIAVTGATGDAAAAFALRPAPHPKPGESSATVRAILRDRYLAFAQEHPTVLQAPEAAPEPVLPWSPRRGRPATDKELGWVNRQLQDAERRLFDISGGCLYCHKETARQNGLPTYAEPKIADRWLPHSRFRHDAHRMLRCVECHDRATGSTASADVLLPKVATCQQCHTTAGGARTDCVECHQYHHGDRQGWKGALDLATLGRARTEK